MPKELKLESLESVKKSLKVFDPEITKISFGSFDVDDEAIELLSTAIASLENLKSISLDQAKQVKYEHVNKLAQTIKGGNISLTKVELPMSLAGHSVESVQTEYTKIQRAMLPNSLRSTFGKTKLVATEVDCLIQNLQRNITISAIIGENLPKNSELISKINLAKPAKDFGLIGELVSQYRELDDAESRLVKEISRAIKTKTKPESEKINELIFAAEAANKKLYPEVENEFIVNLGILAASDSLTTENLESALKDYNTSKPDEKLNDALGGEDFEIVSSPEVEKGFEIVDFGEIPAASTKIQKASRLSGEAEVVETQNLI